tara:strand:+ start:754 stop:1143 length:390 start_codon:yes stop_codon:yes gene_type:complete
MINLFIGFAGNIGLVKTNFTKFISQNQKSTPFYEPVSDNPYLKDFYNDMGRWSFNLQIYFLHKRFKMRNRNFEMDINPEYLHTLNIAYNRWIYKEKQYPVLIINTNDFNIFKDKKSFKNIENKILKTLL